MYWILNPNVKASVGKVTTGPGTSGTGVVGVVGGVGVVGVVGGVGVDGVVPVDGGVETSVGVHELVLVPSAEAVVPHGSVLLQAAKVTIKLRKSTFEYISYHPLV